MTGRRVTLALIAAALVVGGGVVARTLGLPVSTAQETAQLTTTQAGSGSGSTTSAASPKQAKAAKPVNHCAHNHRAQLVLVSIKAQHAWMCARTRTVYDTPVTTGMQGPYTKTPTGHFRIQGRDRNTVLTLNTGAQYAVKYWIPFDAPEYGFHDSSWQHFPYGSTKYKTAGSHGCVHMPLKAMKYLYRWARIGAAVTIRT